LSKNKICYVSPLSIHSYRYMEAFVQRGYDIFLVADSHTWMVPEVNLIPTKKLPLMNRKNFLQRFVPNSLKLARILREVDPDLVHLHAQHHYSPGVFLGGFPFILTSWGKEVLELPGADPARVFFARFAGNRAHMITVDAECLKEIWASMAIPENKLTVIPFGVDTKRFNPNVDGKGIRKKLGFEEEDVVITSTRPYYKESHYNISCLLKAIPLVVEKHENAKFLIKGAGPLEEYLKRLVHRLNVSSKVCFVGIVGQCEIPKYLAAADIYVSTCIIDSTSVSLLEAMACGLAPTVTDVPGNREWIVNNNNGFLFPPRSYATLAKKLVQLIEDEALRERFGRKCVQIIKEKATWEDCVSEMESIYRSLL